MFKMIVKRLPWRGEEVKARLVAEHKAGIRALAEFVADRARIHVPVDTGALRASIHVARDEAGGVYRVVATARHAEMVEFGHRMRNGRFHPANPFMRKALNDGARAMPQFLGGTRVRQGHARGDVMGATFQ